MDKERIRQIEEWEDKGLNVVDALAGDPPSAPEVADRIRYLTEHAGNDLYADVLNFLTFMVLDVDEAWNLWQGILVHKARLEHRIGRRMGVRVAALDYLMNIRDMMPNPRIIAERQMQDILESVNVDELTQLYNHRYFQERLQDEIERGLRYNHPVSLIMFDVDNFKAYNDAHGHRLGDLVLREVGRVLNEAVRETDCACRYGGDEFAVICPETEKEPAKNLAERILEAGQLAEIERDESDKATEEDPFRITFSVGVATFPDDCEDRSGLIELADMALYFSKRRGRNRVTVF